MTIRRSGTGEFFGCIRYPDCAETIGALDREPYEPEVEDWMRLVGTNERAPEPPWVQRFRRNRETMLRRLESSRPAFSGEEWENLIGSVILCSGIGSGRAQLGQQRRRVELIVAERRRR